MEPVGHVMTHGLSKHVDAQPSAPAGAAPGQLLGFLARGWPGDHRQACVWVVAALDAFARRVNLSGSRDVGSVSVAHPPAYRQLAHPATLPLIARRRQRIGSHQRRPRPAVNVDTQGDPRDGRRAPLAQRRCVLTHPPVRVRALLRHLPPGHRLTTMHARAADACAATSSTAPISSASSDPLARCARHRTHGRTTGLGQATGILGSGDQHHATRQEGRCLDLGERLGTQQPRRTCPRCERSHLTSTPHAGTGPPWPRRCAERAEG